MPKLFHAARYRIRRAARCAFLLASCALAMPANAVQSEAAPCIASPFELLPDPPSLSVYDETGRFLEEDLVDLQRFAAQAAQAIWNYLRVNSSREAVVILSARYHTPYSEGPDLAGRGRIFLPAGRFRPMQPEKSRLALHHELTHLIAPGKGHNDRLLIEGLAVHVEDRIGHPNYPDGDETSHDTVRAIEAQSSVRIPLARSEAVRLAGPTGEERRLAYAQQGSFVGWLIETKGVAAFMEANTCGEPFKKKGWNLPDLEQKWRNWLYRPQGM